MIFSRACATLRFYCAALLLTGCSGETVIPDPASLTREAIGHYCNMIVVDHPGPKAQVFEKGKAEPLWFSSVRDGLAYLSLPGEAQQPVAVYVHDMGRAGNWNKPPIDGIWINARDAVYVIGSSQRGGMGAREAVPFKEADKAGEFAAKFGGRVVAFDKIPTDYLVGDGNEHMPPAAAGQDHYNHKNHHDHKG